MMSSRGMGAIAPSKMPKGVRKPRRDNTDFLENGVRRPRRDNTDFLSFAGQPTSKGKK